MNFDKTKHVIYCDLDGVLADFDAFKKKLSKEAQTDDAQMWAEISKIPDFYRHLNPTPYAAELWQAIKAVESRRRILTAIPRRTTIPTAEQDKRWWCNALKDEVFGGENVKVEIGPYSRDKKDHCNPCDILIDDKMSNCQEWSDAGGIAIFHDGDVKATIKSLKFVTELNV